MQEALWQYRERTAFMWDSLPRYGGFRTADGLTKKVHADGRFRPFYGDTVIFSLPPDMIKWLAGIQTALYEACGDCLAERIAPDTFHVTLHDLLSRPEGMPDGAARNRPEALAILQEAGGTYPPGLGIRSCCMFSMVGTSIVMGFEPAEEMDCAMLTGLYERFQQVVPLSYPLTLHVTLAYYKPGAYDEQTLFRLRGAMERIGRGRREWRLSLRGLHYATFESMARYSLVIEEDPWNLARFVRAQAGQYDCALREIRGGRKQSHWIWYVFPQLRGLGMSSMADTYGIGNLDEARAYLSHPILGRRLKEIAGALLELNESDPGRVMGYPDNLKLCSSMTLFAQAEGADPVFEAVLQKYYGGKRDGRTLQMLKESR